MILCLFWLIALIPCNCFASATFGEIHLLAFNPTKKNISLVHRSFLCVDARYLNISVDKGKKAFRSPLLIQQGILAAPGLDILRCCGSGHVLVRWNQICNWRSQGICCLQLWTGFVWAVHGRETRSSARGWGGWKRCSSSLGSMAVQWGGLGSTLRGAGVHVLLLQRN